MTGYRQITVACTLIALLSACTSNTAVGVFSSSPPAGTLNGELMTVGGPAPGLPRPTDGWITVTQGTTLVVKMQVNGTFTQILPAGTYTLTSNYGRGCKPVDFTITPGHTAAAQVICDVR